MASTSRSGRTIRPSRYIRDSLDITSNESKGVAIPSVGVVTCSMRGKKQGGLHCSEAYCEWENALIEPKLNFL